MPFEITKALKSSIFTENPEKKRQRDAEENIIFSVINGKAMDR